MPDLSEITYSQSATVAAFRDYYQFLTKLYLKESDVVEPPEGGWPLITAERLAGLKKDDEVIELFRRIPYVRGAHDDNPEVAPWTKMWDWESACRTLAAGKHLDTVRGFKLLTEGEYEDAVPSSVVGITHTGPFAECFLLDTEQGTISWPTWPECNQLIKSPDIEVVMDDAYEYCENEQEAEWRDPACWAIADFFKVLKDQFRKLAFIPISMEKVLGTYSGVLLRDGKLRNVLQDIYREHGWPDLDQYRKEECLEAVRKAVVEKFPEHTHLL
ncbi:hypothetical protein GLAREA_12043 [Glarea lozoyensis ATCC 20868]|uniref:Uncharacterized protein n=1 Tax=Glarea lozoyensis (strain ATCC 20868 / MF5171) TaxID=1116229 RepID=S3DIV1_GLAL2|nr:uncharacterized protein GLAREA_12043 [Glarea lozoyensis ATCC 20868]EPE31961.1 hypothetical protein GLAREA_12043 [Glarea lozoyensis ATCC 20868]